MPSNIDIDFSSSKNIEIDDGKAVDRIVSILDYHQFVVNNELNEKYEGDPKKAFVSFCRDIYTKKSMLDDCNESSPMTDDEAANKKKNDEKVKDDALSPSTTDSKVNDNDGTYSQ